MPLVQENPEIPILEMPRTTKVRRTARISMKPIKRRFSERIIAKGGPSRAAPKENIVIDVSSDSEISREIENAAMELIAMDKPFIPEEEDEEDEEKTQRKRKKKKRKKC
ncbi:hypothetical protein PIB30_065033 [Stylosanthes scabra]|uniref:Uncharacterized protein n=1 Tax=Stylosanthes scabra TaxID=79078 RepID=A0ABU6QLH3_9FABA|nr:hypothetical protein [Stylosanthes scabra]